MSEVQSTVKPIPDGMRGATPYLCCRDAARALEFYGRAFGAVETMRLAEPSGRIGHAEMKIGEAVVMLSDEHPEMNIRSPQTLGGTPIAIHLYVEDVDGFCRRAVEAGATLSHPVADQFYGDRSGQLHDPFGHRWSIATHVADVSIEEMQRRYDAMTKDGAP
jgi:PhnB protein